MPVIKSDKRYSRVIKFLNASTAKPIAKKLATRGFSDEDREEGWGLLERAAGRHQKIPVSSEAVAVQYQSVVAQVDDWENNWFDVAEAALKRLYPELHDQVFMNLAKVPGNEVLITVRTFLDRLDELANTGTDESKKAMALLEKRGLTAACRGEAVALLEKVKKAQPLGDDDDESEDDAILAAREAASNAMWEWYLDWSKTARTVVKNRNHRVMLGISNPHSKKRNDEDDEEEIEEAPA